MAEELENQNVQQPTEEEVQEQQKKAMAYFKKQTQVLKIRADYEEQLMRIATYQRDTLFAHADIARFQYEQKLAEEESKKAQEEINKNENKEESPKTQRLLKTNK